MSQIQNREETSTVKIERVTKLMRSAKKVFHSPIDRLMPGSHP